MAKSIEILPDESKFDTLEKYIQWLSDRVASYETLMAGKNPNDFPCNECALRELRLMLSKAKNIKSLN